MEPKTKTVFLPFNDVKEAKFVIQEVTAGVMNDIMDEAADIRVVGRQQIKKVFSGKVRLLTVLKCLREAPFEVNVANVRNMDYKAFEALYDAINNFSGAPVDDEGFTESGKPISEAGQTPTT